MNILASLFAGILAKLPPDVVKKALDQGLDAIENAIEKSETKLDDAMILPAIQFLRKQLGIEETPGSAYSDKPDGGKSGDTPDPTPTNP